MITEKTKIKPHGPSASRMVDSLRDTGYVFTTAIADIVDNSVAAGATRVDLQLDLSFDESPILTISDNGKGMDETDLEAAMTYGSPKRPSAKSLGKFGIGLKTASTSFCQKLTVMSRKDGEYNIRQWDLEVIRDKDEWLLIEPMLDEYEEEKDTLDQISADTGTGTIVIWQNIDRLIRRASNEDPAKTQIEKYVSELEDHLSGVFFNFLTKGNGYSDIDITINGKAIEPWDPFCRWLNDDGQEHVEPNNNKPFRVSRGSSSLGEFVVNVYILPNQSDISTEDQKKMRYGLDSQGFYVFREGRMISAGGWPNRLFTKEPHLNLIRVELAFDHELDEYFQIDIKKSRIDLPKDIRSEIKKVITPARNEANKRYRRGKNPRPSPTGGSQLDVQHDRSSNAIGKHHDDATSRSTVDSYDANTGQAEIQNKFGKSKITIKRDENPNRLVQTVDNILDGVLWEPALVSGNRHAVNINTSHEFYKRYYLPNQSDAVLVQAMDTLLWSLAEAELSVFTTDVRSNLEELRINVSRSLRTLAQELPEVQNNADADEVA